MSAAKRVLVNGLTLLVPTSETEASSFSALDAIVPEILTIKLPATQAVKPPRLESTDMLGYIREIFEPNDTVLIAGIHATQPRLIFDTADVLAVVLQSDTVASLADAQEKGYNIFVCMNPVDAQAKNRQKQNIAAIRTVYIDIDENGDNALTQVRSAVTAREIPAPHFVLRSSPGKYYVVWKVQDFTVETQEGLNRALQQKFGADRQSIDAARVLRLPGTLNLKYDTKPVCEIVEQNAGPRLKPSDFTIPFTAAPPMLRVSVSDKVIQEKMVEVRGFLDWAGIDYTEKAAADGGILALFVCPFEHKSGHHDGEAFAGVGTLDSTGNFRFECKHDSCAGIGWKGFRERIEKSKGSFYAFGMESSTAAPTTPANHLDDSSDELPMIYQEADAPEAEEEPLAAADDLPDNKWFFKGRLLNFPNAALYGVTGDIIRKLHPQTESHPAGNLLDLLISLGSIIGRGPHYIMEGTRHGCNEFGVRVGKSAKSRKGTGANHICRITEIVDGNWRTHRNVSGLGSGEVMVHAIRDSQTTFDKKGQPQVDHGVSDKRLHIKEGEFASVLVLLNKKDSRLSVNIRDGWDGSPLQNLTKTDGKQICREPHVSVMADSTSADVSSMVLDKDKKNGCVNRFLWCLVERTKKMPHGGEDINWEPEILRLIAVISKARLVNRVFMTANARRVWTRQYDKLSEDIPGVLGTVTGRAEAHCLRLALLLALLDETAYEIEKAEPVNVGDPEVSEYHCHIDVCHLKAAFAFWEYCFDSARLIFGGVTDSQEKILAFLSTGPKSLLQIVQKLFHKHRRSAEVQSDLDRLIKLKKIAFADDLYKLSA